jgi:hypothetical protein
LTFIKLQMWDNGYQAKRGRARFKVMLSATRESDVSKINTRFLDPRLERSVPLPAAKGLKEGIKKLGGASLTLAKWGTDVMEQLNGARAEGQPPALVGWLQRPGEGTRRDYEHLFMVMWERDDGDDGAAWIPRFVVFGAQQNILLSVLGMRAETYGKPKAPWWLGYHDPIGYNEHRKQKATTRKSDR